MGRVAGASSLSCAAPGAPAADRTYRRLTGVCARRAGRRRTRTYSDEETNIDDGRPPRSEDSRTVSQVGEFGVIDRATRGRRQPPTTLVGPGDDAALVVAADGRVVVTTDMLVQGRHFRLDWSTPEEIGRKAIAQNGADVAAMGARCSGFLVALGCPPDTPVSVTDGINDGLWREASRAGASIVGGDLVQAPTLVISITALGDLEGRAPVLRSGAATGDVVAFDGRLGWSAAGLAILQSGLVGHDEVTSAHRVPQPPYSAGVDASRAGATSLTDISDGLVADLAHIAVASGVGIELDSSLLPVSGELVSAAAVSNIDPLHWVLAGGEDHALAATFPVGAALPDGWVRIGVVGERSAAPDVMVDGAPYSGGRGWVSFQS